MRGAIAALAAAFLGIAPAALAQPEADSRHLDVAWVAAPDKVESGADLVARIDWDRNDAHGTVDEPTAGIYTLDIDIVSGIVEKIPSACEKGSKLAAGGRKLTCALSLDDDDGVMGSVDLPVRAWGGPGEQVVVRVSDDVGDVATTPIALTASAGVDVALNSRALPRSDYTFEEGVQASVLLPIMIAAPAGGMPLEGQTIIDLEISTEAGPDVLAGAEMSVVPVAGDKRIIGVARTTSSYPAPNVELERVGDSTVRLRVDMPGVGIVPPRRDPSGHVLDVLPQASFGLRMSYPIYDPNADNGVSTWRARVSRVEAHAGGRVLTEQIRTHNDEAVTPIVDTGGSSAKFLNGPAPASGGLIAQPGHQGKLPRAVAEIWQPELGDLSAGADGWSGAGPVLPGDQLVGIVSTARYAGTTPSSFAPGTTHGLCLLFDESAPFTGRTSTIGLKNAVIEYRAGGASLDDTDCGAGTWSDTPPQGREVDAIRVLFDPAEQEGEPLGRIAFAAGYRVPDASTEGEYAWMAGMASADTADHWYASDTQLATTEGGYGSTTTFRDAVRVQRSRTTVELTASKDVLAPGEAASLRATTLVSAAPFADRDTARVRHELTLPRGFVYVPGTGPDCELDAEGRVLTWTDEVPVGEHTSYDIAVRHVSGAGTATGKVVARNEEAEALNVDAATARMAITESTGMQLTKTTESASFALSGSNRWTVALTNRESRPVELADTLDVLPFTGDARGTLTSATPLVLALAAPPGTEVWVSTADPAGIDADPAAPSNGAAGSPSSIWEPWDHQEEITAVRWISRQIPAGASLDYTIDYAAPGATNGDRLINSAQTRTGVATTMINSMSTTLVGEPSAIQVDKELISVSDDIATFAVTVRGAGPGTARNILVADLPRQGLSDVRFDSAHGVSADGSRWRIAELAEGQVERATVTGRVTATTIENLVAARICEDEPCEIQIPEDCEPNVDAASDTDQCDVVTASHSALLQIDKELDGSLPAPGQEAKFNLTVRNGAQEGPWSTARNITVMDLAGSGIVGPVRLSDPSEGHIEDGVWRLDELTAGESASVTVFAVVDDSPQIVNAAWISSPELPRSLEDPMEARPNTGVDNDDDQADVITVSREPRLAIDKRLIRINGDELTYRIDIGNLGGKPAPEVSVTDVPGDSLAGAAFATPERGRVDGLIWHVGTLEAGERASIELTARALGPTATNQAHVDAPGLEHRGLAGNDGLEADDDQGDTETTTLAPADLRIDKRIVSSATRIGFEVEVCNLGGSTARDTTLTDEPSQALADFRFDGEGAEHATEQEGEYRLALGDLRPGDCQIISSSAQVTGGGQNIAHVTSPDDPLAAQAGQVNKGIDADNDGWDAVTVGAALATTGPSDVLVAVLSALSIALGILALVLRREE